MPHVTFSFPASSESNKTEVLDTSLLSKQSKPPPGPSKLRSQQILGTLVSVVKRPVRESVNLSPEYIPLCVHLTMSMVYTWGNFSYYFLLLVIWSWDSLVGIVTVRGSITGNGEEFSFFKSSQNSTLCLSMAVFPGVNRPET